MLALSAFLRRLSASRLLLATALLCGAWSAQANTYKVGVGSQCSFGTVAEAVNAALHRVGASTIYIASNQTYSNQAISISPIAGLTNSISIVGGVPDCNNLTPSGSTTLNGSASASVITVRGAMSVTLSHLTLGGGHGSSGGGIDYAGTGNLSIDNSTISYNNAGNGGGIRFQGNGGAATMVVNTNTLITDNIASGSGGGISLEGQATMTMDAPSTWIASNHATNGFGGGIYLTNGATANIGSPGYLFGAAIYENEALNGGGIASVGGHAVRLYTTNPLHPIAVDNNTAYQDGGGVYMIANGYNVPELCAANFRITNNIAKEGSAMLTDDDASGFGTDIGFNTETEDGDCKLTDHGSVACDASQQCSIVHDNFAMDVLNGNTRTTGAAMLINYGTRMYARNLDVRGNIAGYALHELGNTTSPELYTNVHLINCLFADNTVSAELVLASGSGPSHLNLENCTFAHDSISATRVIAANDTLAFTDNIIDEGSQIDALAFSGNASNLTVKYNIAGDTTGFPVNNFNLQGRATFVDVAHGDYRLFYGLQGGELIKSLGIDYAPTVAGEDTDIRGLPRDQPISSPFYGMRDVGAYEMQGVGDHIFIGTFGDSVLLVH